MLTAECRGALVVARNADRDDTYRCPECKLPVILKRGRVHIAHFAHQPGSLCAYGEGESESHRQMKMSLFEMFASVELEVSVVAGRRADAVVSSEEGTRFVVEFQASSISVEEWEERTRDYASGAVPVLWVWHVDLLQSVPDHDDERRLSAAMLRCAEEAGGLLWVWRDDRIYCVGLLPPSERRSQHWGTTTPSSIRGIVPDLWFPNAICRSGSVTHTRYTARRGAHDPRLALVSFEDDPVYREFEGLTVEWNMWHVRWNEYTARAKSKGTNPHHHDFESRPDPRLNYKLRSVKLPQHETCPHSTTWWCDDCYGTEYLPFGTTSPARKAGIRWEDHYFSDSTQYGRPLSEF
jgi:hypothetical protein